MGHGSTTVPRRYLVAALLTLMLLSGAALLAAKPAGAQTDLKQNPSADVQFSQQLDELKKSFGEVGRQIDESAKSIDTIKSPEQGRKSIEELRGQVAKLLDAVADNGEISRLGAKALALAEEKLKIARPRDALQTRGKAVSCQPLAGAARRAPKRPSGISTARARTSPTCCARCRPARTTSTSCCRSASTRRRCR